MTRQYRILERPKFEKESVYIAQYSRKFLWLIPFWSTYQQYGYESQYDREFETVEQAKTFIVEDAKWNNWNANRKDQVIAVFQMDVSGVLMEVV